MGSYQIIATSSSTLACTYKSPGVSRWELQDTDQCELTASLLQHVLIMHSRSKSQGVKFRKSNLSCCLADRWHEQLLEFSAPPSRLPVIISYSRLSNLQSRNAHLHGQMCRLSEPQMNCILPCGECIKDFAGQAVKVFAAPFCLPWVQVFLTLQC